MYSCVYIVCFFFVLQELVMDILRVLSSPDLEVRKKTLQLVLDLVTSRNIHEVHDCRADLLKSLLCKSNGDEFWLLYTKL